MLLAEVRPDGVRIEHAAGDRRVTTVGNLLQQGIGDPHMGREAWIDLSGAEEVSHHLPAIDTV
jgi:hypothetical protein